MIKNVQILRSPNNSLFFFTASLTEIMEATLADSFPQLYLKQQCSSTAKSSLLNGLNYIPCIFFLCFQLLFDSS